MRAGRWAGALLVVGLGLAFWLPAGFGLVYVQRGLASRQWPVVRGVVTEASWTASSSGKSPWSTDRFEYRYGVDGRDYTSRRYSYRAGNGGAFEAVRERGLRPGDAVDVRHHPSDPAVAVVDPGMSWWVLLVWIPVPFLMGLAVIVGGLADLWVPGPPPAGQGADG